MLLLLLLLLLLVQMCESIELHSTGDSLFMELAFVSSHLAPRMKTKKQATCVLVTSNIVRDTRCSRALDRSNLIRFSFASLSCESKQRQERLTQALD